MNVWIIGFATSILLFQIVSVPALVLKKNDLSDVLWGPAFVFSALAAACWGTADGFASLNSRSLIILGLLAVWAARLFAHVGWRNLSHKSEDVRYNNWRKSWGDTWVWRSYLQVFVLQALILNVFLSPVLLVLANPSSPITWLSGVGLIVAFAGLLFEAIADEQLRRFKLKSENKGRLLTHGLWGWSRHPNYFGEVSLWWGIWLSVVDLPWGWVTIVSPLGVTYLILKVSGVPMLEDLMKSRPGYEEYKLKTPAFIPGTRFPLRKRRIGGADS